ncbi:MAG: hypothetical protein NT080_00345 [Spirochaetes bacterium]|nr:hypothetical protein [Spirochaetota bacterium]
MIKINVKLDIANAKTALTELGVETEKSTRMILMALAMAAKKRIQQGLYSVLRLRTGWLRKHTYARKRSATHYAVAAPTFIAEILERGGTIRPKKGKYLTFLGDDGQIRRARQVTIPATHWFSRSIAGFEDSPEYKAAVQKGMDRAIRKFNEGQMK